MKVTEHMHLQRITKAVTNLQELLRTPSEDRFIYRLAVARRFSVCYYAFLSYLIERMKVDEETAESLTMEDIMLNCRYLQLFTASQEQYVMKMGMIYAALSCYEQGYQEVTEELIRELSPLAEFLGQYCALQSTVALPQPKPIRRAYEYSV